MSATRQDDSAVATDNAGWDTLDGTTAWSGTKTIIDDLASENIDPAPPLLPLPRLSGIKFQ